MKSEYFNNVSPILCFEGYYYHFCGIKFSGKMHCELYIYIYDICFYGDMYVRNLIRSFII